MIYFSSYIGSLQYPYMICEYRKSFQLRDKTACLFVDSGILCKERNIDDIVKYQRAGDIVASPDIIENVEQTVKDTLEWYKKSKDIHSIDKMCFVLQGKNKREYIECYNRLIKEIPDISFIGLGGLLHSTKVETKVKEVLPLITFFKDKGLKVHVFGLGLPWLKTLVDYEPYSFDSSTPIRIAIDGFILDENLKSIQLMFSNNNVLLRTKIAEINIHQIDNFIKHYKSNQRKLILKPCSCR